MGLKPIAIFIMSIPVVFVLTDNITHSDETTHRYEKKFNIYLLQLLGVRYIIRFQFGKFLFTISKFGYSIEQHRHNKNSQ